MKSLLFVLLCAVSVGAWIETVPELSIGSYVGRWYQAYGNRLGWLTYGENATCIIADYALYNKTTVTVRNGKNSGGQYSDVRGWGYTTNEPGKFRVQLNASPAPFAYWVIKLGPVNSDNLYDYAVATSDNPELKGLYVLARDIQVFKDNYDTEVKAFVEETGFTDYLTEPIATYHGENCLYPDYP